jgi:hypothetical protein
MLFTFDTIKTRLHRIYRTVSVQFHKSFGVLDSGGLPN